MRKLCEVDQYALVYLDRLKFLLGDLEGVKEERIGLVGKLRSMVALVRMTHLALPLDLLAVG